MPGIHKGIESGGVRWLVVLVAVALPAWADRIGGAEGGREVPAIIAPATAFHTFSAECTGQVRADRAIIVGAMTADSVKPVDARDRIDRQLAELQKLAKAKEGRVILLERVRAARSAPERGETRPGPLPFRIIQRLEIDLPATAAIDAALEQALQLGLDRFGVNVRPDHVDGNRQVAVRYRFSSLRAELDRIRQRCRQEAVRRWCSADGAGSAVCAGAPDALDSRIRTRSFAVDSQPLLAEQAGVARIHLSFPWQSAQLALVEPLGDLVIDFQGTIQLEFAVSRP